MYSVGTLGGLNKMEKKKLIHLEIEYCDMCPYKKSLRYTNGVEVCMRHERHNRIYSSDIIPDWCPLPDVEE